MRSAYLRNIFKKKISKNGKLIRNLWNSFNFHRLLNRLAKKILIKSNFPDNLLGIVWSHHPATQEKKNAKTMAGGNNKIPVRRHQQISSRFVMKYETVIQKRTNYAQFKRIHI